MTFQPAPRTHLSALLHGRRQSVAVSDITHFRADCKYVTAYHPGGELLLDDTIKHLALEFAERFIQIRRDTLVARHLIVEHEKDPDRHNGGTLRLSGIAEPFGVGRRFKETVLAALNVLEAA